MSVSEREMNTQITWHQNKKGIRALDNQKPKEKLTNKSLLKTSCIGILVPLKTSKKNMAVSMGSGNMQINCYNKKDRSRAAAT